MMYIKIKLLSYIREVFASMFKLVGLNDFIIEKE